MNSSIRPDSMAQLLSFGNVFSGARLMVMDSYGGLLVGAILERLAGEPNASPFPLIESRD